MTKEALLEHSAMSGSVPMILFTLDTAMGEQLSELER